MNKFKKLMAFVLTLTMVLSMNLMVSASGARPTSSSTVTRPATVNSITIAGTTAKYQKDNNTGDTIYIRAALKDGSRWSDLKNATVSIQLKNASTEVSCSDGVTFTKSGTTATATNVNLINKAYDLTIGSDTYVLAAGFNGKISLETNDSLAVKSMTLTDFPKADVSIYGVVVQSPYMGNSYYDDETTKWTDPNVSYYVKAEVPGTIEDRSSVEASLTLASGASASGCATGSGSSYRLNLTASDPIMTVTNGGSSRQYHMFVSELPMITVDFGFNFGELELHKDESYYADVKAQADVIAEDAAECFGGTKADPHGTIQVPSGTSVMDVLEEFTNAKGYPDATTGSTYIASINGLGEFDGGSMSGWMYSDSAEGWSTTCNIPMVGAADYTLTDGARITWFYTCDYGIYWN